MASLQMELILQGVPIMLPNGGMVLCTKIVVECPLEIGGITMEANLIVFNLLGFHVILCIDWLYRHFATVDCQQRMVTFYCLKWDIGSSEEVSCDQCWNNYLITSQDTWQAVLKCN